MQDIKHAAGSINSKLSVVLYQKKLEKKQKQEGRRFKVLRTANPLLIRHRSANLNKKNQNNGEPKGLHEDCPTEEHRTTRRPKTATTPTTTTKTPHVRRYLFPTERKPLPHTHPPTHPPSSPRPS